MVSGPEALANFNAAAALVTHGHLKEAREMKDKLFPSDWIVIQRRIEAAEKARQATF